MPLLGAIHIRGDADRLRQLLLILLDNACRYTPGGGQISLELGTSGPYAVVTVSDTGIGIPADELDLVPGRFYRGSNAAELKAHDLVLDRETREVRRGDRLLELTPREFALLECLMRSPGKVISRPLILEQVWGYSGQPLTNVVEVYIRHLRRKVDQDAPIRLIETVRGFGYRIRPQ
jgi:hypothetical protein